MPYTTTSNSTTTWGVSSTTMSYTTYNALLRSVYDTYIPDRKYPPNFGVINPFMRELGELRQFPYRGPIISLVNYADGAMRWYDQAAHKYLTLEDGLKNYWVNPPSVKDIHDVCEKFHSNFAQNHKSSEVFLTELQKMTGKTLDDITQIGNFISVYFENRVMISFLPRVKYRTISPLTTDAYIRSKVTLALGKFVKKYFALSDVQVEELVDKAKFGMLGADIKLSIVSGEDITKWYTERNYANNVDLGDLANSCMRYFKMKPFLELYEKNPNQIQMIVALAGDRVAGRALVWTAQDGNRYLDRIYGARITKWLILDYAAKNNIGLRENLYNQTVKVDNWKFAYYPYMDTIRYWDMNNGIGSFYERMESTHIATSTNGTIRAIRGV